MPEGDAIPDTDTFGVHCQPSKMDNSVASPSLFLPRIGRDEYLSGAWMEYSGFSSTADQIREVCRQMIDSEFRKVRASHKMALLGVAVARGNVLDRIGYNLVFLHHPMPDYGTHSGAHGIEQDQVAIAEELAELADTVPVVLS